MDGDEARDAGRDVALVYTVCASEEEALAISRAVVAERLAACTNLWPIASVYTWEGETVEGEEIAMLVKTVRANVPRIWERVRELHSYDLPCLLTLRPGEIESRYAAWLRDGSSGGAPTP